MKVLGILIAVLMTLPLLFVLAAWIHNLRIPEHEPGKAQHFTKLPLLILAAMLYVVPASADTVDYSLSVTNVPGIGDFSWTIETNGFIPAPGPPFDYNYLFNSFVSVSQPSVGGCGISGVFLDPNIAPETFFSPLCGGKYEGYSGGAFPAPGTLGTWNWSWDNGDGTQNLETLTISDPPGAVPEPGEALLLLCGLLGLAILKIREPRDCSPGSMA